MFMYWLNPNIIHALGEYIPREKSSEQVNNNGEFFPPGNFFQKEQVL